MKICVKCGETKDTSLFRENRSKCKKCNSNEAKKIKTKQFRRCAICDKSFIAVRSSNLFCSTKCSQKNYHNQNPAYQSSDREKKCEICNTDFVDLTMTNQKRTCSNSCKIIARKKYHSDQVDNITNSYIKTLLRNEGLRNPKQSLVEIKRLNIKLKRLVNEKQRETKSSGGNANAY